MSNTQTTPIDSIEMPEYDAFISYKHGPIDSAAAKALQKNLEHFHTPLLSGLPFPGHLFGKQSDSLSGKGSPDQKTERKIRRVFLDDGELSACAAFVSHIREALKHSRWLIIICSPETKRSPWVNMEIEIFLEYHDRDHILAVMTDGEPADIFPDAFLVSGNIPDEIFAADARGRTVREVEKKLRGDTLLRIAAPLLGTTYDGLKQRHRIYRLQRLTAVFMVCFAAITVFLLYAFVQNRKLEKSNNDLWLRQAEIVTQKASELLAEGDNLQAVQNLLSVLPDPSARNKGNTPDNLLLPSTQYELTRALNLYNPESGNKLSRLAISAVIRNESFLDEDLISDQDGSRLLANAGDKVIVWNAQDSRRIMEIPFSETIKNWSDEALIRDNRIILCGEHTVACFDYVTGTRIWKVTMPDENCTAAGIADSENIDGEKLYVLSQSGFSILSTEDGTILSQKNFTLLSDNEPSLKAKDDSPAVTNGGTSPEDKENLLSDEEILSDENTEDDSFSGTEENFFSDADAADQTAESETPSVIGAPVKALVSPGENFLYFTSTSPADDKNYLFACIPETGETLQVSPEGMDSAYDQIMAVSPVNQGDRLYYTFSSDSDEFFYETIFSLRAVSVRRTGTGSLQESFETAQNDSGKKGGDTVPEKAGKLPIQIQKEWANEYLESSVRAAEDKPYRLTSLARREIHIFTDYTGKSGSPQLLFGCCSRLFLLNPVDGKTLSETSLPSNLSGLNIMGDFCLAFTNQGGLYYYDGKETGKLSNVFPSGCNDIQHIKGSYIFYCLQNSSRRIVKYTPVASDDNFTEIQEKTDHFHCRVFLQNGEWSVWYDSNYIIWISEQTDEFHSLPLAEIAKDNPPENVSGSSGISFSDDLPVYSLLFNLKLLCLEGDHILFADTRKINSEDGNNQHVFLLHNLCLTDSSLVTEPLFILDSSKVDMDNLVFDQYSRTLYYMTNGRDYMTSWSCSLNDRKVSKSIFPPGRIDRRFLSPDHKKVLLGSSSALKLYIADIESMEIETSISLSDYHRESVDHLLIHASRDSFSWNGDMLAIADYMKIHIYDMRGKEVLTIPYANGTDSFEDYNYPYLILSPGSEYLYCCLPGTLSQYSIPSGQKVNEIALRSEDESELLSGNYGQCLYWFDHEGSADTDTLHLLTNSTLYVVRCNEESFGITASVENVIGYNEQNGRIYLRLYNAKKSSYHFLFYKEYTLENIIKIAKERYPEED